MTDAGPIRYATTEDGMSIAHRTLGGVERQILFISGFGSDVEETWMSGPERKMAEASAAFDLGLIVYDQRGTGRSTREVAEISAGTMLQDLQAVVRAVHPEPLVLWAGGMAGPSALQFAQEHSGLVDALILQGTFAFGGDIPGIETLAELMETNWPVAARLIADITLPRSDANTTETYGRIMRSSSEGGVAATIFRTSFSWDTRPLLVTTDVPTLVLHQVGARNIPDRLAHDLATRIPGAELSMVHWANPIPQAEEEARELWQTVSDFLNRVLPELSQSNPLAPPSAAFRAILFTDVVASTPLLAQLKDEKMRAVMRDHDEVLEAAVTENGGRVVKTIGDAFMAEFAVPSGAVEAAIAAQRGIRDRFADFDVPIRLRIGINAGEPIEEDGDLHGASVVIAKRLESEADNGGILVSDVVRSAVAGKEFEFVDRGEVSLKGFDEPVRAWGVE